MPKPGIFDAAGGGGAVANATGSAALAADVVGVSANVYFDGPTLTLAAGTWYVTACATLASSIASAKITLRLWDGTNTFAETETEGGSATTESVSMTLSAIIVLAGSTTIKLSAASSSGSNTTMKRNPLDNSAAANVGTLINAIRTAQ